MPNVAMCKKVYDYITSHPDEHDQRSFESRGECGTTRCIAGWAAYLDGWRSLNGAGDVRFKHGATSTDVEAVAAGVLRLSAEEADTIFYEMDESIATAQLGVHAGVARQEDVDRMRGKRDASFMEGSR